jgi:hypothetical protein
MEVFDVQENMMLISSSIEGLFTMPISSPSLIQFHSTKVHIIGIKDVYPSIAKNACYKILCGS